MPIILLAYCVVPFSHGGAGKRFIVERAVDLLQGAVAGRRLDPTIDRAERQGRPRSSGTQYTDRIDLPEAEGPVVERGWSIAIR